MSDIITIEGLPELVSPTGNEFAHISVGGVNYKIKLSNLPAGGGGGDVTAPTVVSCTCPNSAPNTLVMVFDEAVTGVAVGDYSFKNNGSAWAHSSVSGSGTTWTFTMASSAAYGDTLLRTYSGSGTIDGSSNALAAFTDVAVTNSVGAVVDDAFTGTAAADLTAHTPTVGGAVTKVYSSSGVAVTNGDGTAKATTPNATIVYYKYANVFSGADQKATIRLKKNGVSGGTAKYDVVELYLRCDTTTADATGYYVQIQENGMGSYLSIHKKVNGVNTELVAVAAFAALHDNSYHDVSIEVIGSTINVRIDGGSIVQTTTDSALTAGRSCVVAYFVTDTAITTQPWIVDRFTAENL